MALEFNVRIEDDKTRIEFGRDDSSIEIVNSKDVDVVEGDHNSIYFLLQSNKLIYVGKTMRGSRNHSGKEFDKYIYISAPKGIDINFLEHYYVELAKKNNISLINSQNVSKPSNITKNRIASCEDFAFDVQAILEKFGFDFFKEKKWKNKSKKPRDTEKIKMFKNNRIVTIGGRMTRIYVDDILYEGNMASKLREIAKEAKIDWSKWEFYKQKGTVHFALELMKHLP